MSIVNRHHTPLPVARERAAVLIDALASRRDRLWPSACWPALRLDWPLMVAARGGHGPIGYVVEQYVPGQRVRFRFDKPQGFHGWHELRLEAVSEESSMLVHELVMRVSGSARLTWPLLYRPLHDALIEDAFAQARATFGQDPSPVLWSRRVRWLRSVLSLGAAAPQTALLAFLPAEPAFTRVPPVVPADRMTMSESSP